MSNKLISTDGIWYKIRRFFSNLFFKKKLVDSNNEQIIETKDKVDNQTFVNELKEKFEIENKKQILANKLLYGEIGASELEESETNEMIEYFTQDIQNIDREILRVKQHIISMQQELENN